MTKCFRIRQRFREKRLRHGRTDCTLLPVCRQRSHSKSLDPGEICHFRKVLLTPVTRISLTTKIRRSEIEADSAAIDHKIYVQRSADNIGVPMTTVHNKVTRQLQSKKLLEFTNNVSQLSFRQFWIYRQRQSLVRNRFR